MSKYITLFLFALIGLSVAAQNRRPIHVNTPTQKEKNDLKWWNDSKAAILTSRSFEGLVGKDKYVVVQFCATFSKECEALQPEYNRLAEMYSGASPKHPNVFIGKIDGWTFNSLSQTYSVKRFPTIRFFNKNDATNSDEFTGEVTAEAITKWIEDTIHAKENPKTEEKKPEEPKKEEAAKEVPKEAPKEAAQEAPKEPVAAETKQPEATNAQQNNQQQQTQQTQPPKTEEDVKKEFKLVLNTTLLQAQFDEVQNQLNKLSETLQKSLGDHFQKVESLKQAFESHKNDFHTLSESLRHQGDKLHNIGDTLHHHKEEIKSSVTRHAEDHLNQLKDSVHNIKNKVHEKKEEVQAGPGLFHNLVYIVIGCAVGAAVVVFVGGSKKKNRSMLD